MNRVYYIKDSLGNILREFTTYSQAYTFKIACGRYDWEITHN